MTEEEAKTKWCFAAVASHTDPRSGFHEQDPNWPSDQPKTFACIASACMAWRWKKNEDGRSKIEAIRDHRLRHNSTLLDAKNAVEATWVERADSGFCGLAGAPQ